MFKRLKMSSQDHRFWAAGRTTASSSYLLGLVLHVLAQEQFGVHIDGLGVLHQVGGALGSAGGAHAQGGGGGVGVRLVQILQSLIQVVLKQVRT